MVLSWVLNFSGIASSVFLRLFHITINEKAHTDKNEKLYKVSFAPLHGISLFFREFSEFNSFFLDEFRDMRTLVFYSESAIYYQYYEGVIDYILARLEICYITSDKNDPLL